jgi:hypothetical protein
MMTVFPESTLSELPYIVARECNEIHTQFVGVLDNPTRYKFPKPDAIVDAINQKCTLLYKIEQDSMHQYDRLLVVFVRGMKPTDSILYAIVDYRHNAGKMGSFAQRCMEAFKEGNIVKIIYS